MIVHDSVIGGNFTDPVRDVETALSRLEFKNIASPKYPCIFVQPQLIHAPSRAKEDVMSKHTSNLVFLFFISLLLLYTGTVSGYQGKSLYERKCGRCHVPYEPDRYSVDEWPGIVRSMMDRAALTTSEYDTIIDYVTGSGQKEGTAGAASYGPRLGGYLYTEYFQTEEKTKNFDIHYLAVSLAGWATEDIYYFGEFELEHGGKGDNTFVEQAFIDYRFMPNMAVRIGAMLTPFNRFDDFHDPIRNYAITRPQISREIGVSAWKDVGVDLHGFFNLTETSSLGCDVYTINGLGSGPNLRGSRQYRDNNEDKAFGGRLNFVFRDRIEVGGSVYRGAWNDAGDLDLTLLGVHCMLNTDIIEIYGEYMKAGSENPSPTEDGEMSGYFIQASHLFRNRYRPTVRFGDLDYLDRGDSLGREISNGNKDTRELVFSFGYYPASRVVFKIEYQLFHEGSRKPDVDNDQLGVQAAVAF